MPFASDDDHIAGLCHADGKGNGLRPVADAPVVFTLLPLRLLAAEGDLSHDLVQWLGARVLGGDDHPIRQPPGDAPHPRPFLHITQPRAAENDDHLTIGETARCLQGSFQRPRRVGEIHEGHETLAFVNALHAPDHAFHAGYATLDGLYLNRVRQPHGHRRQAVVDIILTDEGSLKFKA